MTISLLKRLGIILVFTALAAIGNAQSGFSRLDEWMNKNSKDMGGRTILVIYKDGKMVYNKSVNDMSRRQKSIYKYIAKRMGQDADPGDYNLNTRQMIASCSKWLSASLVMTFVDEGKLRLCDTVGTYLPVLTLHGKGNITISECLSHLTGIKAPPLKESLKEFKNISSMNHAIDEIAILPMEGTPGKVFHYSNIGLQIAGAVIRTDQWEVF